MRAVHPMSQIRSFNRDFEAIVKSYGTRPVLIPTVDGQDVVTYDKLDGLIDRYLSWLASIGAKPGDRIGAVVPNSVEMLTLFLACLRGGYGFAPLACDTSGTEAQSWIELVKPRCVVLGDILPDTIRTALRSAGTEVVEIRTDGANAHLPAAAERAQGAAGAKLYLFTSGTTGRPKAIVLDGDRLWSAGHDFLGFHGFSHDTPFRIWNYLPQSYLGGLFNLCLIPMTVAGSAVVDQSFSGKTFLEFWQTVDRYDLNALWLVPTIVRGLLSVGQRTKRYETKSYRDAIKIAFLGTAPIELAAKTKFEELFGITLLENYALSETTFLTTERQGDLAGRSDGRVGKVLPSAQLDFRPVAENTEVAYHEILAKTSYLFDGYLEEDGAVRRGLVNGFFPTGDLGYVDDQEQLVVTGRCKDVIKKGGQLVSLREIELLVLDHPAVSNAAATPIAHPFYGETYKLFVQLTPEAGPDALDELRRYVYDNVAKYKWPDAVESVTAFEQTGSGKIRKFLLPGSAAT